MPLKHVLDTCPSKFHIKAHPFSLNLFVTVSCLTMSPARATESPVAKALVLLGVASKEIIQQFGGRIDARDAMNQTPAHTCAKHENPEALVYLHANARKSFEVLNLNNQKPTDIAEEEENDARLFFAKLEAQKKTKEVNETSKENKRLLDLATDMAVKCKDCFGLVARKSCNYQKISWFLIGFVSDTLFVDFC